MWHIEHSYIYISHFIVAAASIDSCTIIPPSDITATPQQYLVQMITSGVPPGRLSSFINCTDGDGITCGKSYYTLINLDEERFQLTVPVTWSANSVSNIEHVYSCTAIFGGRGTSNYVIMMHNIIVNSLTVSIIGSKKFVFFIP